MNKFRETGIEIGRIRQVLKQVRLLILDFDGPVCSVFSKLPGATIAERLRQVLLLGGVKKIPTSVEQSDDPFCVFRYAASIGEILGNAVENALTQQEIEAVSSARPTPGAVDLIHSWHRSGRDVSIASNNSLACVDLYVEEHGLRPYLSAVHGRRSWDPSELKPSPYLLRKAMEESGIAGEYALFIGDSLSDIFAAKEAQITSCGLANKSGKMEVFEMAKADIIVPDMQTLLAALTN